MDTRIGIFDKLFDQVSLWVNENGWEAESFIIEEDLPGSNAAYPAYGLTIHAPNGRIELEPIGLRADGKGLVSMYAWPTLARVRLLYNPDSLEWEVITDSGVPFHLEWNKQNFIRLAEDLLAVL